MLEAWDQILLRRATVLTVCTLDTTQAGFSTAPLDKLETALED